MIAQWPLSRLDPGDPSSWARHPFPGVLIAVDGVDGSGRATQLDLLAIWLQMHGFGVVRSSWNSSKLVAKTIAEARRQNTLTPLTYSILHATDVAERQETEIIPALRAGYVVLADRYVYTAFARDIARGVERDWIYNLYGFAVRPDLAVYLRIDADISMGRVMGIAGEATAEEADEGASVRGAIESFRQFQQHVVEQYERLVNPFDLVPVDATQPVRTQQQRVRGLVGAALERLGGV
ncbi:MAG: thymidylate kinase [Chloroflexota bacterium]|nr:thymidylate kinase [Chloroflexota bacterium]